MIRRVFGARLLGSVAAITAAAAGPLLAQTIRSDGHRPAPENASRRSFYKDSRGELALAQVRGQREVVVVIAAVPRQSGAAARAVEALGGRVQRRDAAVGYLRAVMPAARAEALFASPAIQAAEIAYGGSGRRPYNQYELAGPLPLGIPAEPSRAVEPLPIPAGAPREAAAAARDTAPWPPRPSEYPFTHPYDPLEGLGGVEFRSANSTFDGRGVTVAVLDGHVDLGLPELQEALTLDGTPVPKIVDYLNVIAPEEERGRRRWVRMTEVVTAHAGVLVHGERRYRAPREGTFRLGSFDERPWTSLDGDVNRDGNPPGSGREFAVLWDELTNEVWVDTNQNLDFADEQPMMDYAIRRDAGELGRDHPATPEREAVTFAIQVDTAAKMVALNLGVAEHGTGVAGAVAASRGRAGRIDGVAPGARIVNIEFGSTSHALIEALILAFKHPQVDIVLLESNSGITGSYELKDGRHVSSVICARLIETYRKPFLAPMRNHALVGYAAEEARVRGAIGIGAYESKEAFFVNRGIRVAHDDNLHNATAFGPAGDGALKPDVLAPSGILSLRPGYMEPAMVSGLFRLPPGYTIYGGTSTATPVAAGAVALLVSAAKQRGVAHDPERIRRALAGSARYIPRLGAYQQGHGLIQVGAAWEVLQALDTARTRVTIESRAAVRTVLGSWLAMPHEGVGIWEREGWTAGDRAQRIVTLTRTAGPAEPMTFRVRWEGNAAGTYASSERVTLPLGAPVRLPVTIAPAAAGVHSALLTLEHPVVVGPAYRMLATIVAAEPLHAGNGFTLSRVLRVRRPGFAHVYVRVPEGAQMLRMDVAAPGGHGIWLEVASPDGRTRAQGRTMDTAALPVSGASSRWSRMIPYPSPGVWELAVKNVNDSRVFDASVTGPGPLPPTPAMVTVSAFAVDVSPRPGASGSELRERGGDSRAQLVARNRMAAFTGAAVSTALGSGYRRRGRFALPTTQQVYEVHVPPGAPLLLARVRGAVPGADLDLYLFDCTRGECMPVSNGAGEGSAEVVTVADPAAGLWKVVVDAAQLPGDGTDYEYTDVVPDPSLGAIGIADAAAPRATGAGWEVRVLVRQANPVEAPREPYAVVLVRAREAEGAFPVALVAFTGSSSSADTVKGQ